MSRHVPVESVVFPEPTSARETALGWVEPSVHWLTQVTTPEAVVSRRHVNDWARSFPPHQRVGFESRLRSEVDIDHYSALDELFVHRLLRERHEDVRYEEHGKGPDFRLYGPSGLLASVEVASLFTRQDWDDTARRFGRIADELNARVPLTRYFLRFEQEELSRQPRMTHLASFVAKTIAGLPDPAEVASEYEKAGRASLPTTTYEAPGVRLRFEFLPRRADPDPSPDDRIVGMGPIIGGMVNSGARLRTALNGKAGGRYDLAGAPYIIAVVLHDSFCSLDQIESALYGAQVVNVESGEVSRGKNAFFGLDVKRNRQRNTRVSTVWVIDGFVSWNPSGARLLRLDNPFAAHPVAPDLIPADFALTIASSDSAGVRLTWAPSRPEPH